eukprot:snap_masked-scaffold_8-processed-gene-2.35-mRNA-1 protein AED:0.04 eAED:0.04 QI:0/-1/0/1/-1/1/1/0/202
MKTLISTQVVDIPANVQCEIDSRFITITGPRGTLKRNLKHQQMEISLEKVNTAPEEEDPVFVTQVKLTKYFGLKKQLACVRTFASHIRNMVIGVTRGFRFKMRFVYAHFPINVELKGDKRVEIRNFLGQKKVFRVDCRGDTTVIRSKDVKDEIVLEGNSIDDVSLTCSDIQQSTLVRNKDIRKFLDGIYVSEKGPIPAPEEN